jgi:hypothetical protein
MSGVAVDVVPWGDTISPSMIMKTNSIPTAANPYNIPFFISIDYHPKYFTYHLTMNAEG